MRALVLQHIACEPPGVFEDVLRERAVEIVRVELDEGDRLPDRRGFDVILAMGGPMSVNDDESLPWLTAEKALIAEAVRDGTAFWGTCLGVQLLAAALGARVYPGERPEVGLMTVRLTPEALEDPIFEGAPKELTALQWHGDTFDLPEGAVRLAGSVEYPNQAFRWGSRAYGIQFHIEVSVEMAREWATVPAYSDYLDRVLGPGSLPKLVGELESEAPAIRANGRRIFERFLDLSVS
jgi:GMP synthase (glutamine-hydrolysing)